MSITLDLSRLTSAPSDTNIQHMPCEIQHDGDANVTKYFETSVRKNKEGEGLTAAFRGRPLDGKLQSLPEGYTGIVFKEVSKPFDEEEERTFNVAHTFKDYKLWNLDRKPSEEDKSALCKDWIDLSKVLHEPV